jgi:hypothetical protein
MPSGPFNATETGFLFRISSKIFSSSITINARQFVEFNLNHVSYKSKM